MALTLYNTLTRRKEEFAPLDPANVRMYVCGPTVYDFAHIGNARPVIVFDVLYRMLRDRYGAGHVKYARNITDVDDKINAAAKANGEPIAALTARTAAAFHEDVAALGCLPPDVEPRATQHIAPMTRMVEALIASGHAYVAEGHVLFAVPSMPDYGRLSRRDRDELIAGARVEVAPYKRDPADFVLWKPSPPDLPGWDSPWGRGRPGWHLECSAMSEVHLGETFDIHGGGLDLIFPHHENEIAQSVCAHRGKPFVKFWLHNGFVTVNGAKMAKSEGNFVTIRDVLKQAPGEAARLAMLTAHYRDPLDWTAERLTEAKRTLDRFYLALRAVEDVPATGQGAKARGALDDDLNTPLALAALHEDLAALNKAQTRAEKSRLKGALLDSGVLLGILQQEPESWLKGASSDSGAAEIEAQIAARNAARKVRNFAEADRIRNDLALKGILLEDGPGGTTWRRAG
ncbi:MAG: cysteine--tRNA ligase [Alphaproteobacteria bacterium]|nr:cysteine--tRNA ligase [Alphaproteobacteria bacterium]